MTIPICRDQVTVVMICIKDEKSLRPNEVHVYLFVSFFEMYAYYILLKMPGSKSTSDLFSVYIFPKQEI